MYILCEPRTIYHKSREKEKEDNKLDGSLTKYEIRAFVPLDPLPPHYPMTIARGFLFQSSPVQSKALHLFY